MAGLEDAPGQVDFDNLSPADISSIMNDFQVREFDRIRSLSEVSFDGAGGSLNEEEERHIRLTKDDTTPSEGNTAMTNAEKKMQNRKTK